MEEAHENQFNLFSQWLSQEANEANAIKKDTPVMCVIGNPPYSVSSNNKSPWIENLVADYKKNLNERNIQPLSDDYIKFIRFGQHFIEKNGEGILAYISNNSFIDGIIHRQMRKNLLETFDKIFILDLHGNSKKQEVCKDGSPDQNVFDIMQGVSINIFVKSQKKNKNELNESECLANCSLLKRALYTQNARALLRRNCKMIPLQPPSLNAYKNFKRKLNLFKKFILKFPYLPFIVINH